jgi:hypothetical protein
MIVEVNTIYNVSVRCAACDLAFSVHCGLCAKYDRYGRRVGWDHAAKSYLACAIYATPVAPPETVLLE